MPGRMVKIGKDDPGITIEGEDYKDVLARKEKQQKEDEAEQERKREIGTKTKHKKKLKPRERYEDDSRRVSKRVHRLSDFEIRKEYGIMSKPMKTLTQNVLYVLFNAGDVSMNSRAIADELARSLPDVSSVLSGIWKKLKDTGLITREKKGLAYHYLLGQGAHDHGLGWVLKHYFPPQGGHRKPVEPVEPAPAPGKVEIPEWYKGPHKYFVETGQMLLERIEALETDGLERKVVGVDNQLQELANNFKRYKQGISADIREIFDLENKPPGEFNINFNVRFLFGSR